MIDINTVNRWDVIEIPSPIESEEELCILSDYATTTYKAHIVSDDVLAFATVAAHLVGLDIYGVIAVNGAVIWSRSQEYLIGDYI